MKFVSRIDHWNWIKLHDARDSIQVECFISRELIVSALVNNVLVFQIETEVVPISFLFQRGIIWRFYGLEIMCLGGVLCVGGFWDVHAVPARDSLHPWRLHTVVLFARVASLSTVTHDLVRMDLSQRSRLQDLSFEWNLGWLVSHNVVVYWLILSDHDGVKTQLIKTSYSL